MPENRTAILFFSHRPEREWQNKWFVEQDYATNRRVAEAFYEHTRQAVADSGFPVLEVTDAQQQGDSFGERLANAMADAFAEGYDRVIAVGSDCPALHEVEWGTVAEQLDDETPVLGPNPDGEGTYLIGLTRAQFDPDAFPALPWKTPDLLAALRRHLAEKAATAPVLLASRDDVNGPGDLRRLLQRSSSPSAVLVAHIRQVLEGSPHSAKAERPRSTRSALPRRARAPPTSPTSNRPC